MDDSSSQFSVTNQSIDESKVCEDDGDIYLFQWLSSVERFLQNASSDDLKTVQRDLGATLVLIITKGDPFPAPGRALRNVASNCLVLLYTLGESRAVFEVVLTCLKVLGDFKSSPDRDLYKIASCFCIGEIMISSLGGQLTSFMVEIATVALKTHKTSSNVLLRYHALVTLRKTLATARRAATDSVMKDILKQMRSCLLDKSLPVRRAAAEVLSVLYPLAGAEWTSSEIEQIISICVKSLDGADQDTRRSLANLAGKVLASSQLGLVVPVDNKKKDKDETDVDPAPASVGLGTTRTILTVTEMFQQLSIPFNKPQASHKTRVGIFDIYYSLLITLGASFVEAHYGEIIRHLMYDIVANSRNLTTRFDILFLRRLIGILLRDLIGVRMLGEQAQIGSIQELSNAYLKRWPALMPGHTAPSSHILAVVLREVAGLLLQLGNAPPPVQDALAEPLIALLAHPSHTIRVSAGATLRIFCSSAPLQLPKILINIMELLQRDVNLLNTPATASEMPFRAMGYAYGLAALVTVIPSRPLYISYDTSAKVLDTAIQLLKRSGDHEVNLAQVEIEIAWTCIASLMTLGPNFVRAHLPQLLVLWRNALPKPTSKDSAAETTRTASEWLFLLRVREAALGAIYCFLKYNSPTLVTLDVARRVATMLSNALLFVNGSSSATETSAGQGENPQSHSSLRMRESLLRRRIFQCFMTLGVAGVPDSAQAMLLQTAIGLVASPESYSGSSVQAAITSSSGLFVSLWQSFDNYAYGVTSISLGQDAANPDPSEETPLGQNTLNRDSIESAINDLLSRPILVSCEYDPLSLCQSVENSTHEVWPEFPPPDSQTVDAAIQLYAYLLPLQETSTAAKTISLLIDTVRSPKFEKNLGRRAAARVNVTTCLVLALRNAMSSTVRTARDVFRSNSISSLLFTFLKDALTDSDDVIRMASSEALGRLANVCDSQQFLAGIMKTLVDQVVNNRDPQGRAGCSLALGAIYNHVGSLAAGPLLKTTVNILMSLSKDAHPLVHFWALQSLGRVVNAASLAYAPYVPGTLGMLLKVYLSSAHEIEGGSVAMSNTSGDLPVLQVVCKIIDATITVLGPDIQDTWRTRTLILDLVRRLMAEEDEGFRVEAIKCIQHFLLFAPDHVNIPDLISQFRSHLKSSRRPLKLASIHAFYQLVQRDAVLVSKIGGDDLVQELFSMLDGDPSIEGVRKVIISWLQQTAVYNPSAWIDLCQKIMSRATASQQAVDVSKTGLTFDDEGASLSVGITRESEEAGPSLTSRWRTQLFALQCLHELCSIITRSGRKEQVDLAYARSIGIPTQGLLVSRVSDMIKMAFTASTAFVTDIRLEGLVVLRDIIEIFSKTPDPDYNDALLMEQYQAPITAALTPAFTADSTPEILASAVGACAVFVGCGVVKDVSRMGRILKLLISALEQCKGSKMLTLGDASEGSPNASAMLRIATLSAWAELASASTEQPYLADVIKPYRADLASLWIAALRDYASIRAGSEVLQESSSPALDTAYASLGRDILLPYYAESWPVILHAVSMLMEARDIHMLAAMSGQDGLSSLPVETDLRGEPTALFFVIFGLVYETLSISYSESPMGPREDVSRVALMTMKSLVAYEYSGRALLEPAILDELLSLWYRMAMTEGPSIQTLLVEAIVAFSGGQDKIITSDSSQMHCLRICAYILKNAIPGVKASSGLQPNPVDRVQLLKTAFDAVINIGATVGPATLQEARAIALSLYGELLKNEASDLDFVGPTLPVLKRLITIPLSEESPSFSRVIHGFLSACILNLDDMKGRQGSISLNKSKNNLLAAALVLTSIPASVLVSEALLNHVCFLITEKLLETTEIALTAAYCVKTLFAASSSGNIVLRQCVRRLLPAVVEYTIQAAAMSDERVTMHAHVPATEEILKAFGLLFAGLTDDFRALFLGILLPALTALLDTNLESSSILHSQAVAQLLGFASTSPTAFKEATIRLDQAVRDRMETAVRGALTMRTSSATQAAKPQISLRSF